MSNPKDDLFNFIEPQDDLTLVEFLRAGTSATDDDLKSAAERLGVADLLPLSLIKLSNGQIRRALIARALLSRPELLILDDPFLGLDAAGRDEVAALLGELRRRGTRVLLITRPDACGDQRQMQRVAAFRRQRQADQPAAVRGHKIDRFRGDELGRHGEIAFVFAVFVVDHYHHAPGAELLDRFRDGCEWHRGLVSG